MLVRYGKPSKYDIAPYGKVCKVITHNDDIYEIYLQTSKNLESPCWEILDRFDKEAPTEYVKNVINYRLNL